MKIVGLPYRAHDSKQGMNSWGRGFCTLVHSLKSCLEPSVTHIQGGSCPLRACGTRFAEHEVAALKRVVNRFSAYLSHIIAMTEDTSLKLGR